MKTQNIVLPWNRGSLIIPQMETPMTHPVLLRFRDGPADKPNGWLVVKPICQASRPHFYRCEIISVIASTGRVPAVGTIIEAHRSSLDLYWKD